MKVKNERLYGFLKHMYKRVKVQNCGMPFRYRVKGTGRDKEIVRLESGEEYAICCPVCKDTRFRLNISHGFGERLDGVEMRHVFHCWNEECDVGNRLLSAYEDFLEVCEEDLKPADLGADEVVGPFSLDRVVKDCQKNLMTIKGATRVDKLPEGHPAVRYLLSRNFSPKDVGEVYGVSYCENNDYAFRAANRRLIIPLLYKNEYVGWQARAIEGLTRLRLDRSKLGKAWQYLDPKYWTSPGTRKSYFLYSFDLASRNNIVVVAEGPTDAWRIGAAGVAILGRKISRYQRMLLADTWGGDSCRIVLFGDPGFEEDWKMNYEAVCSDLGDRSRVSLVLPRDKDPGDLSQEEIWERIHAAVKK